jgi:hypothetical protein
MEGGKPVRIISDNAEERMERVLETIKLFMDRWEMTEEILETFPAAPGATLPTTAGVPSATPSPPVSRDQYSGLRLARSL